MYYYAYIDSNNICQGTYSFPSQITDANYIYLGTEDDQSVIGKQWNATTQEWEEVTVFYYAVLNAKDICTEVKEFSQAITNSKYIRINSLDTSLIGLWYNRDTLQFETAPIHILADHSTNVVNYKNQDKWLNTVLDEKANISDVYNKTQVDLLIDGVETTSGASAYQVAVNNGFVGTESQWLDSLKGDTGDTGATGANGLSAYQIAVNNGFNGTETEWLASLHGADGSSASVTADDVLTKIKTVDGANSGLDADMLDGKHASEFALSGHTHSDYASSNHTHDGYASADHTHDGYALTNHTHPTYSLADHSHSGYANATHTHSISDVTNLQSALDGKASSSHNHSGYASSSHTHAIGDITNLQTTLNGKASSSHTHSEYASSSHTHSDYFAKSGGTISGDVGINGVVRVQGQQCLYNSGSMITLSTNNLSTMIAGSSIYSKQTIQVSSDERLKDVLSKSDKEQALNLIKNLNVVDYVYKDKPNDEHIGVIAQELEKLDKRLVKRGEDGYLYVRVSELIFPLIIAVQELLKK